MNTANNEPAGIDLAKLEALARAATPGPWMRLFGEPTVYDRMEDGCRGIAIVRADLAFGMQDAANLDFIAAANPATMLALISLARSAAHVAPAANDELVRAADAVVERWHSRDWKQPHTRDFIERLAAAVGAVKRAAYPAPVAAHADDVPSEVERLTLELQNQRELTQHWKAQAVDARALVGYLREAADIIVDFADSHRAFSNASVEWVGRVVPKIDALEAHPPAPVAAHADDDCYCGGFGDVHQPTCPEAHAQQDAAPAGYKLVPVEPTVEMRNACYDEYHKAGATYDSMCRAIVAAAPGKADAANAGGQDWISVNERLPAIGQEVLIWCGYRICGYRSDDKNDPENHEGWVIDFDNGNACAITHWMPLPEAPGKCQSPATSATDAKDAERLEAIAVKLDAKSAEAETWRENENNEFMERIWLGAREGFDEAARIVRAAIAASQKGAEA